MARAKLPLAPLAVYRLVRDVAAADDAAPVLVGGARGLASVLRRELGRGAAPGAVVDRLVPNAVAAVHVLAGPPSDDDERALRDAHRARVPVICVLADPSADGRVPYVLATDVIRVPPGSGFPLEEIAAAVAHRLGDEAPAVAARVPALRAAVCEELIGRAARQNAIIGAAVFVPGADLPVLTLNQLRLVLRIAAAHGEVIDAKRWPEIVGVVVSGLGFRALARQALAAAPAGRWAVKGGVAYAGTLAVGEAALRYFEARATRPPAEASRAGS